MIKEQQQIFDNYFTGRANPVKQPSEIVDRNITLDEYPYLPGTQPNTDEIKDFGTYKIQMFGQRAKDNTDIFGFATMVGELLNTAWQDEACVFTINGAKAENISTLPLPMIVFDVIERTSSKIRPGVKSRAMELQIDPEDDNYSIIIHRKWFDAIVEFLVLDTTNQDAIKLADRFELFIDTFTGFFKEAGVSELIFYKEIDSRLSKNYIDGLPSRCLRYQLVIERIVVERVRTTKEVRSRIQATSLNKG